MPTTSESFQAAVESLLDDDSKLGHDRHTDNGPHSLFSDAYEHDEGTPFWARPIQGLSRRARRVAALSPELADED